MHALFSSQHRSSGLRVSLSLAIVFAGSTLHAQLTTLAAAPPTPSPILTASAAPLDLSHSDFTIPPYISSSADTDQPAPPADIDAPQAQSSASEPTPKQTSRILGILPNFRAVSADVKLPPADRPRKIQDRL